MPTLICDDVDDHEDVPLPAPRACRRSDNLTPRPPKGWIRVMDFCPGPDPITTGAWLCAIKFVQAETRERGKRCHAIATDATGTRVLVVAPELLIEVTDMIEDFNGRIVHCNCGGSDCLEGELQHRALQVHAKRAWEGADIADRIEALSDTENGVALAFAGPMTAFEIDDTWALMYITGA